MHVCMRVFWSMYVCVHMCACVWCMWHVLNSP
jgi:hypothetical protein